MEWSQRHSSSSKSSEPVKGQKLLLCCPFCLLKPSSSVGRSEQRKARDPFHNLHLAMSIILTFPICLYMRPPGFGCKALLLACVPWEMQEYLLQDNSVQTAS